MQRPVEIYVQTEFPSIHPAPTSPTSGRGNPGLRTYRSPARIYFVTDIDDGATLVDADSEVEVRSPVLASIDSTEMELELWLPV